MIFVEIVNNLFVFFITKLLPVQVSSPDQVPRLFVLPQVVVNVAAAGLLEKALKLVAHVYTRVSPKVQLVFVPASSVLSATGLGLTQVTACIEKEVFLEVS